MQARDLMNAGLVRSSAGKEKAIMPMISENFFEDADEEGEKGLHRVPVLDGERGLDGS